MELNLYEILEISQNATTEDIGKAYRKLAKKYFPKKNGSTEQFQLITNAYEILSDEKTREKYDQLRYNSYISLKDSFNNHKKNVVAVAGEEKKELDKNFNDYFNKKHNVKEDGILTTEEAIRRYMDLQSNRVAQYEKVKPEMIFEKNISQQKFNEVFDIINKGKTMKSTDTVLYETPSAWGRDVITYSDLNENELYTDDPVLSDGCIERLSKEKAEELMRNSKQEIFVEQDTRKLFNERKGMKVPQMPQKQTTGGYGIFDDLGISFDTLSISAPEVKNRYDKLKK